MKNLLLTGLSTDFDIRTKETYYFLLFNHGEIRIPVSEQAAEVALMAMGEEADPEPQQEFESQPRWIPEDLEQEREEPHGYSYQPYNSEDEPEVDMSNVALNTGGAQHVEWDAPTTEGAEIFSASDYDSPPDSVLPHQVPPDIDDGVAQL